MFGKNIYWARNDLRLHDNLALDTFLKSDLDGLVFWCPTKSYQRAGLLRQKFIDNNVSSFSLNLNQIGLNLIKGNSFFLNELTSILATQKIESIYFTQEYSTEERTEEKLVTEFCQKFNVKIITFDQGTLIAENHLPFELKNMPFVFTDFRKKIESQLKIRQSLNIDIKPALDLTYQGEGQALLRLKEFIWDTNSLATYKETRNGMINFNDSSKLSPWINIGAISPRKIFEEIKLYENKTLANESTYWLVFELFWRDYFKFLSKKFGYQIYRDSGLVGRKDSKDQSSKDLNSFQSWCQGQTDEPFVNANMKELNATGFMSNRGRQNVASYLIHQLNLPWTWGASYFEQQLVDYDPDINWGNWLYLSGKGTDPRARIFNIKKQANDYDPFGEYQKKWNAD